MIKVLKGRERRVLEQRLKAQYSAKIPENLEVVLQLLKPEAKIINLSLDQAYSWVRGRNLDIKAPEGYVILKYDGYYLGCGLSRGEHIKNLYPKHRRIV